MHGYRAQSVRVTFKTWLALTDEAVELAEANLAGVRVRANQSPLCQHESALGRDTFAFLGEHLRGYTSHVQ